MLKTHEVAALMNVSPHTIRRMVKCSILNAVRLGPRGHLRFDNKMIDDIVSGKIKLQMSKDAPPRHTVHLTVPNAERKLQALLAYKRKGNTHAIQTR